MMTDDHQDALDAARTLSGDLSAFEGIVHRWQHRLINLAWRFCRDRVTAEDMAQEVFVKVFRSLATFRGDSAFSTWVMSIAVNTYRTRLRADGLPLFSLDPSQSPAIQTGALQNLQEQERAESVRRAVLALPEKYREAILLFYFEEKSLSDAARVLGVAEGTLKARLHRGRELLRRRCENLGAPAVATPVEGL